MKTKWIPMFCYNPVATRNYKLVYTRYDNKTGLFDFKTQTICRDVYSTVSFNVQFDAMDTLNKLLKQSIKNAELLEE